jgi:hypothetical protein
VERIVAAVGHAAVAADLILRPHRGEIAVDLHDRVADRLVERSLAGSGHDPQEVVRREQHHAHATPGSGSEQRHASHGIHVPAHLRAVLGAQALQESVDRAQHGVARGLCARRCGERDAEEHERGGQWSECHREVVWWVLQVKDFGCAADVVRMYTG